MDKNTKNHIVLLDSSTFSRSLSWSAIGGKVFDSHEDVRNALSGCLSDDAISDEYTFDSDEVFIYEVEDFTAELNDDTINTEGSWFFTVYIKDEG